jgi:MoaA/NifB/PqqE/SkfB family radical SAM enzyme
VLLIILHLSNYDEKFIKTLKKVNGTLCISLHGVKEIHDKIIGVPGYYKRAMETINNSTSHGIPILVSFTVTREKY